MHNAMFAFTGYYYCFCGNSDSCCKQETAGSHLS